MKIAIVTGEAPHHKHLCVQLARHHNVVAILHSQAPAHGITANLRRLWKRVAKNGAGWTALNLAGQASRKRMEQKFRSQLDAVQNEALLNATRNYNSLDRNLIHSIADFGSDSTLALVRRNGPEAVICLGGPIYPKRFIEACPLVLNYHSGYSPVYNGTSTIWFAFANGHPQFCGGTLMTLNPVVDGGDILGHFLPTISPDDNPVTLFHKTTLGAALMYERILAGLENGQSALSKVPQSDPLFFFRAADWTLAHSMCVKKRVHSGICRRFVRDQQIVEYWRQPTVTAASNQFEQTTQKLLQGRP